MANTRGIVFRAGGKNMTVKQIKNAVAASIARDLSTHILTIDIENDKKAIRTMLQVAAIVFQRVVSRTPIDEDYDVTVDKEYDTGKWTSHYRHKADNSVCRYDWELHIEGTKSITYTARDFVNMKEDFGDNFNDKKDIQLVLDTLLKSGVQPKKTLDIVNHKMVHRDDFNIWFDNQNPHFKTLEYGRYKKGPTEPKQGEKEVHGINEDHFSYQAPKGFYAITMAEYKAFVAEHGDKTKWRTISQKMLRQATTKILSDKKFGKLGTGSNATAIAENVIKQTLKENEQYTNKIAQEENIKEASKKQENEVDIEKYVFDNAQGGYWSGNFKSVSEIKRDKDSRKDFEKDVLEEKQRRNMVKVFGGKNK